MRIEVQWFVSALKDNQLITLPDAVALDRELGGDAELGAFAQTLVERLTAGLDQNQTAQWVESIQQLINFAVEQTQTGAVPELELPPAAPAPAPAPAEPPPPPAPDPASTPEGDFIPRKAPAKKKLTLAKNGLRSTQEVSGNGFQCFDNMRNLSDQQLGGMMKSLLLQLSDYGASSLHLATDCVPFVRRNHKIERISDIRISPDYARKLNTALMSPEQLEQFDKNLDLNFSLEFRRSRFRASVMLQNGGIYGTYHIVPGKIQTLEELGFLPQSAASVTSLCASSGGLILVASPADSGRTTTIAAMLELCGQTRQAHIITIEDPVEIIQNQTQSRVTQRQVRDDTGDTTEAFERALRQDPDILVVDACCGIDAWERILAAASENKLVIVSVTAPDAVTAAARVVNSFPDEEKNRLRSLFAAGLRGIISQQLVSAADGNNTIAYEILLNTPAVSNFISLGETAGLRDIMKAGSAEGMCTFDGIVLEKMRIGTISKATALELVTDPDVRQEIEPAS